MKRNTPLFLYSIVFCLLSVSTAYSGSWPQAARDNLQSMINNCYKANSIRDGYLKEAIELKKRAENVYAKTNIEDFYIAHNTFSEAEKLYIKANMYDACQLFEQAFRSENQTISDRGMERIEYLSTFIHKADKLMTKGIDQFNVGVKKQ